MKFEIDVQSGVIDGREYWRVEVLDICSRERFGVDKIKEQSLHYRDNEAFRRWELFDVMTVMAKNITERILPRVDNSEQAK